jgi:transposase InsO family protein
MDLFVVPTISFRLLCGLLILHHDRRQILWLGVTAHPTAEWISRQLTEAYGWKVAPQYIIRDRDAVYGDAFIRRLRAMSIRDRPTAPRSPWQNGYCERAIGSIRRECLDPVVVFGEWHLRHLLRSCATYYNEARTHLQSTRTRRRREQYMPLVAFCLRHFSADFIICMCEFDFRQAHR